MLARRRSLRLNGQEVERTPLLVPSFSSKGFPDVSKIIEYSTEMIEGSMLVSAYDLHYEKIKPPFDFASLLFLDSGGYEASKDAELSDYGDKEHIPQEWSQEMHEAVLAGWAPSIPSIIISYDHPKEKLPIREQIRRAENMAPGRTDVMREILLKPETETQTLIRLESIIENIHGFANFSAIGVTEKEIGNSVLTRMQNIARFRLALDKAGIEVPLHIFGSLDTVTTPLYFLAGADIFDGLTWLRFAFHQGQTLYKQNYGALHLGVKTPAHVIDGRCWNSNYYYITDLELEMRRFLNEGDFASFRYHGEQFRAALESVREAVGG
ncbi:hypothetical protein B0E33_20635 [Roseibium algicola]|uniref:Uroporphyrinogen decarboxylase (URO-D) domain-containing protein n=1 Tax=Roseibium algicola TaxID=2857014 RepID=A0ABM6I5K6_9HYPH|nr:hypothetical protein [Roseibium aggregatum]AQQ05675.1 hypothetical protein B0E33_20635 [Roseibium aggregatum]